MGATVFYDDTSTGNNFTLTISNSTSHSTLGTTVLSRTIAGAASPAPIRYTSFSSTYTTSNYLQVSINDNNNTNSVKSNTYLYLTLSFY
jgi:hypothetical protein